MIQTAILRQGTKCKRNVPASLTALQLFSLGGRASVELGARTSLVRVKTGPN